MGASGTITKSYVNLIEILFAIVLTQGFMLLSSNSGFFHWVAVGDSISFINTLTIFVLVVGSWIRYHRLISNNHPEGTLRLVLNIGIILMYYEGFTLVGSTLAISAILVIVFSLYAIWGWRMYNEYPQLKANEFWSFGILTVIVSAVASVILLIVSQLMWTSPENQSLSLLALMVSYTSSSETGVKWDSKKATAFGAHL